jgi:hypothetical protein
VEAGIGSTILGPGGMSRRDNINIGRCCQRQLDGARRVGSSRCSPVDDKRHTSYTCEMKPFRWNHEKNEWLQAERMVSFEEVVLAIENDQLLDILQHPKQEKYPNQHVFVVALHSYAYLVPFVEEANHYFLKTIIPSRKATRHYLKRR